MKSSRHGTIKKPRLTVPTETLICAFSRRQCLQNRVDGYEYCIKHILEDKCSPYKQCAFVHQKNNKRCVNAMLKNDRKDGFCTAHNKKPVLLRHRSFKKPSHKDSAEKVLSTLSQYGASTIIPTAKAPTKPTPVASAPVVAASSTAPPLPVLRSERLSKKQKLIQSQQLKEIQLQQAKIKEEAKVEAKLPPVVPAPQPSVESDSESETESITIDQTWRGDMDSDAESVDSEQDDPLKHAGVYTAEEVALITRDKLIRLQSLYIEQFKRLQHVLKERRRKYLHSVKIEKETMRSIADTPRKTADEEKQYQKLKALHRYHKRAGTELLLHNQWKERRLAATEGTNYKSPSHTKCTFSLGGSGSEKCGQQTLPYSKFCSKHIMADSGQMLFSTCGQGTEKKCNTPVLKIYDSECSLHLSMPSKPIIGIETIDEEIAKELAETREKEKAAEVNVTDNFNEFPVEGVASTGSASNLTTQELAGSLDASLRPYLEMPTVSDTLPDDIMHCDEPSPEV